MFRDIGEPPLVLVSACFAECSKVNWQHRLNSAPNSYSRNRLIWSRQRLVCGKKRARSRRRKGVKTLTLQAAIIARLAPLFAAQTLNLPHHRIYNSTPFLSLSHTRALNYLCAGVIGFGVRLYLRRAGVKVDLINPVVRLLTFLDDDISDALSYHCATTAVFWCGTNE